LDNTLNIHSNSKFHYLFI